MNITNLILQSKSNADLKGRAFTIIGNEANHGFKIGDVVKYDGKDGRYLIMKNDGNRYTVAIADVEAVAEDKKELAALADEAQDKAKLLAEYVNFLESSGATVLDETAFQVWKILEIFKNNDEETAKTAIYSLLKKK